MQFKYWIPIALPCLLSGFAGAVISRGISVKLVADMGYTDLVSIMLAAASLIITVLALILAIAGVLGWQSISKGVQNRTTDFLQDGLQDGGTLAKLVEKHVTDFMYKGATIDPNDDEFNGKDG